MHQQTILIGNLSAKVPEFTITPNGCSVCTFSMATNETFMSNGEKQNHTEWHEIVCFGKLAETCKNYLGPKRFIFIEGKIHTEHWDYKGDHYTKKVIRAYKMKFLGPNKEDIEVSEEVN
ncbi:MAG: single-stranded DNA-binding protein [Candidatus Omnitrophica bacterium]|jgi:single-strand DNA-binding protein|nr:single-stranded DNA-binding protein [Candidatus Omnitrophota bacterium]